MLSVFFTFFFGYLLVFLFAWGIILSKATTAEAKKTSELEERLRRVEANLWILTKEEQGDVGEEHIGH